MPLSFAEEADSVVGIDLVNRFGDAGVAAGARARSRNLAFPSSRRPGAAISRAPRSTGSSRTPSSSTWPTRRGTCGECARVLRPGGPMYLSTAPYLSFAGAHLPRLKVPVPLHLLIGRRLSFAHVPLPRAPRRVDAAREGRRELVHQDRARGTGGRTTTCWNWSASAGCARRSPPPASARPRGPLLTGTFRRLPSPLATGCATARSRRTS